MRMRSHCSVSFLNHAQTDETFSRNESPFSKSSSVWPKHWSGLYRIILTAREPIRRAHFPVLTAFYSNQLIKINTDREALNSRKKKFQKERILYSSSYVPIRQVFLQSGIDFWWNFRQMKWKTCQEKTRSILKFL